jgi:hypothetical protein
MDVDKRKQFVDAKKVPLGNFKRVSPGEKAIPNPIEEKLRSLGFRKTLGGWRKDWTFVVLKHQNTKGKTKPFRLFWDENWTKFVSALIFDYSPINGPICIIPSKDFFNSNIIFEKDQTDSTVIELKKSAKSFSENDEIGTFIFSYKDNWQILK